MESKREHTGLHYKNTLYDGSMLVMEANSLGLEIICTSADGKRTERIDWSLYAVQPRAIVRDENVADCINAPEPDLKNIMKHRNQLEWPDYDKINEFLDMYDRKMIDISMEIPLREKESLLKEEDLF